MARVPWEDVELCLVERECLNADCKHCLPYTAGRLPFRLQFRRQLPGRDQSVGAPTNPPLALLAPGTTYPPPQVPVTYGVDQTLWNTYAQMNAGSPMLVNGVVYQT